MDGYTDVADEHDPQGLREAEAAAKRKRIQEIISEASEAVIEKQKRDRKERGRG